MFKQSTERGARAVQNEKQHKTEMLSVAVRNCWRQKASVTDCPFVWYQCII